MTSDIKNIYSNVDPVLLDFSMIDYFVLQRLSIHKIPIVRYQLMKSIRTYLPDVSTAKFYRILEKFEKYDYVDTTNDNDGKTAYVLSAKGTLAIPQIQQLVNQFGYNIFIHFRSEWLKMFELLKGRNQVVGFLDYENLLEMAIIDMYMTHVEKLYLGCETGFYEYISKSYPQVSHLTLTFDEIKEPDNYFDSFIVFLHDDINRIISEIHRVLKPNGALIVVEVLPPDQSHFINKILFDQFAPSHLKKDKNQLKLQDSLDSKQWELGSKIDFDSLQLTSLVKI